MDCNLEKTRKLSARHLVSGVWSILRIALKATTHTLSGTNVALNEPAVNGSNGREGDDRL